MTDPPVSPASELTARQWQILDALVETDSHQDAADRLEIDVRSLDMALRRMRERFGVCSTLAVLRKAGYLRPVSSTGQNRTL